MKRHSLLIALLLCGASRGDLSLQIEAYSGNAYSFLKANGESFYDDDNRYRFESPVPTSYTATSLLSYDDGMNNARSSATSRITLGTNNWTVALALDSWANDAQAADPFDMYTLATSQHWWAIGNDPDTWALLRIEVLEGAVPEGRSTVNLAYAWGGDAVELLWDGTCYTAYVQQAHTYNTAATLQSSRDSLGDPIQSYKLLYSFMDAPGYVPPIDPPVVPLPGAVLLGMLGLGYAGMRLRRQAS